MQAAVLRTQAPVDTRPLSIEEAPDPIPGAGEVLIRVRACGVCRTDLHVVEGDLPMRGASIIPGHQVVGEIVAFGPPSQVAAPTALVEARETAVPSPSLSPSLTLSLSLGQRVGAAWLRRTCGSCRFCQRQRENLCEVPRFSGWTDNGGFATLMTAPAEFVYPLPSAFSDSEAAPLLCAGIIGYRALALTGISDWAGARLGLYGFGAAGHVAIQLARGRGADVYVATRDRNRHQALATELGAVWVGDTFARPPVALDAAIVFAPAGEIVPAALDAVDYGGQVVLGGIHMTRIPALAYEQLYHERVLRSVANNTRDDGRAFLVEAAQLPVRTHIEEFPLARANEALQALKHDAIRGAAVLLT